MHEFFYRATIAKRKSPKHQRILRRPELNTMPSTRHISTCQRKDREGAAKGLLTIALIYSSRLLKGRRQESSTVKLLRFTIGSPPRIESLAQDRFSFASYGDQTRTKHTSYTTSGKH